MRTLGRFVLYALATLGALTLAGVIGLAVFAGAVAPRAPSLPDRIVLSLDLGHGIAEQAPGRRFELFGPEPLALRDAVDALATAAGDERVKGVVIEFGAAPIAIAHAQELRAAIRRLREAGKFAFASAPSFGFAGGGTPEYYLASAAEEIWIAPSGGLGLTGLALEIPFLAGTLDELDIEPRMERRHEYKSAVETFTRTKLSEPARRSLQRLVDSWLEQITTDIAADRGLAADAVQALIDQAPYLAGQAEAAGLVDRLGYGDEFRDHTLVAAGAGAEAIDVRDFLAAVGRPHAAGTRVALVHGLGAIAPVADDDGPLFDDSVFAAWTVAEAIEQAVEDDTIAAILFRVNSPGGSYLGADRVWHAVKRARAAGKPIVVSLGDVAASGGYFVAMAADRIVAQPATLTGSIGVFSGKLVTEGFWAQLGVSWDEVHAGARATMWSNVYDYPPGAAARLDAMLDAIYADFTAKVASGRGLSEAAIDAAARGRVWTGEAALARGLVDRRGGYEEAVRAVKELLALAPEDDIELVPIPAVRSPFTRLVEALGAGRGLGSALGSVFAPVSVADLTPFARELAILRSPRGVLQLPPLRLSR